MLLYCLALILASDLVPLALASHLVARAAEAEHPGVSPAMSVNGKYLIPKRATLPSAVPALTAPSLEHSGHCSGDRFGKPPLTSCRQALDQISDSLTNYTFGLKSDSRQADFWRMPYRFVGRKSLDLIFIRSQISMHPMLYIRFR